MCKILRAWTKISLNHRGCKTEKFYYILQACIWGHSQIHFHEHIFAAYYLSHPKKNMSKHHPSSSSLSCWVDEDVRLNVVKNWGLYQGRIYSASYSFVVVLSDRLGCYHMNSYPNVACRLPFILQTPIGTSFGQLCRVGITFEISWPLIAHRVRQENHLRLDLIFIELWHLH